MGLDKIEVEKHLIEHEIIKNDSRLVARGISVDALAGATNFRIQSHINNFASAGLLSGGEITDAGSANINVASGTGTIRTSDSHTADLLHFDFAASNGIAIPTDTIRYIGVEYNAGSPQIVVKTTDSWDTHTEFSLGNVVNETDTLHILFNPEFIANFGMHTLHRLYETEPFQRADRLGGLILGETGTRNVTVTAGEIYDRVTEFNISAINTSGADRFDTYSSGGLEATGQAQWDNDNYDNGGTLTALDLNKFANLWWYLEPNDGQLVMVYGTAQYNTEGMAENEGAPQTLPNRLLVQGKLIGRFVFQKGAATASEIESVFSAIFSAAGVTAHNDLSGIQGGAANEYYHLTSAEHSDLSGGSLGSLTEGSVWFSGVGGVLTQDNANLFWDDSNNSLGIGTDTPDRELHIKQAADTFRNGFKIEGASENVIQYISSGGTYTFDASDDASFTATNNLTFNSGSNVNITLTGDDEFRVRASGNVVKFIVDTGSGDVGIGLSDPAQKLEIGSDDGTDRISIYHDNSNANIMWDDGTLILSTDEGTDSNSNVLIRGKGDAIGSLKVENQDKDGGIQFQPNEDDANVFGYGSATRFMIQGDANIPVEVFGVAAEGETPEFKISGRRAGDIRRTLEIGVGVDADDTASFDGVSNYYFDGNVDISGGNIRALRTETSDHTVIASDYTILADATSNTVDITLPASPVQGQIFNIKCIDSTFTCTVDRNGKNIDGAASDINLVATDTVVLQFDSSYGWAVL